VAFFLLFLDLIQNIELLILKEASKGNSIGRPILKIEHLLVHLDPLFVLVSIKHPIAVKLILLSASKCEVIDFPLPELICVFNGFKKPTLLSGLWGI
jgi:hypothetical protein